MIKIFNEMKQRKLKSKLLLQIHDELVFDVCEDEKEIMDNLVNDVMENCIDLLVPLKVDKSFGKNLYETK